MCHLWIFQRVTSHQKFLLSDQPLLVLQHFLFLFSHGLLNPLLLCLPQALCILHTRWAHTELPFLSHIQGFS